jgi:7-carboxy-7-deazaguanine synthase
MKQIKLAVSEVFYSIQGEGKTTGYPSVFVRLGGCNLMCGGMGTQFDGELHNEATWRCDTIEVWMKALSKNLDEICGEEEHQAFKNGAHVIITGGEPMMQQDGIEQFILYLRNLYPDIFVEVETNGTIIPSMQLQELVNQWNCSPKLYNSGNHKNQFYNPFTISVLNKLNTQFKFVITTNQDWLEVKDLYVPLIDKSKIWLMPSGENQELLNQSKEEVAQIVKDNYLKFTNRLHIEIWNKKTGV